MNLRSHGNALPQGYRLHWYRIESVLGQGGFGITYLAHDTNLDKPVAIKEYLPVELAVRETDSTIRPFTEDRRDQFGWGLARFIDEARTLSNFDHPNIVRVHSVFEENATAYMVMTLESGHTLEDLAKFDRLADVSTLVHFAHCIADALEHMHAAGFIHRDVKPANVIVRHDGSPVLLDFGSARLALSGATQTLTRVVSAGYAPYEQYHSDGDRQGPWTDVYGLGAALYAVINRGRGPVDAIVRANALIEGSVDPMESAAEIGAGRYPPALLEAIDAALAFKPGDRPQTVAEFRALLPDPESVGPDALTEVPAPRGPVRDDVARQTPEPGAEITAPSPMPPEPAPVQAAAPEPGPEPESTPSPSAPRHTSRVAGIVVIVLLLAGVGWYAFDAQRVEPGATDTAGAPAPSAPQVAPAAQGTGAGGTAASTASGGGETDAAQRALDEEARRVELARKAVEASRAEVERLTQEARRAEAARQLEEQRRAEAERLLEEVRRVEAARAAEEVRRLEAERLLEETRRAEAALEAEERRRAEAERLLEEARRAEAARVAEEQRRAEAARKAEETRRPEAARSAEEKRRAEAVRQAEEARRVEAVLAAEEKRRVEAQRQTDEARRAQAALQAEAARREKAARLAALLDSAVADVKALRLTSPAGNNAAKKYREALQLDPGNAAARAGQQSIVARYVGLATGAIERGEHDKAKGYLDRAATVLPRAESLTTAREMLARSRARAATASRATPAPATQSPPPSRAPAVRKVSLVPPLAMQESSQAPCDITVARDFNRVVNGVAGVTRGPAAPAGVSDLWVAESVFSMRPNVAAVRRAPAFAAADAVLLVSYDELGSQYCSGVQYNLYLVSRSSDQVLNATSTDGNFGQRLEQLLQRWAR